VKIKDAISLANKTLMAAQIANPNLDCELLLRFVLKVSREDLWLKLLDDDLNSKQYDDFLKLINLRVTKVPIAHLINNREFYGLDFYVDNNVLDPRPDSETLVDMVISSNKSNINQQKSIIDVGCGSGCLLIAILKNFLNWEGLATDISPLALAVAQKNALKHFVANRINFLQADLFHNLLPHKKFDILISNPPYIPSKQIQKLQDEVRIYEPRIALDGGDDGLDFYRKIAAVSPVFLQDCAEIFLEIGINQHDNIIKIFSVNNFQYINNAMDINGIIRVLHFRKI